MRRFLILMAVTSLPAHAQGWAPRSTDTVLDRAAMQQAVIGATHEFFDGGRSFFDEGGTYSYTYSDGLVAPGSWTWPESDEDGVICTAFQHGFERCDLYVHDGTRLVLLTYDGLRLPVRVNSADD